MTHIVTRFVIVLSVQLQQIMVYNLILQKYFQTYMTYTLKFTVTYYPEFNGLTENRNREIGKLLSKEKE